MMYDVIFEVLGEPRKLKVESKDASEVRDKVSQLVLDSIELKVIKPANNLSLKSFLKQFA